MTISDTGAAGDGAPLRLYAKVDAANLRALCKMAHHELKEDVVRGIGRMATRGQVDILTTSVKRLADGAIIRDIPFLHTVRVIAPDDEPARAFAYCAPPKIWIFSQGVNGLSIQDREALAGALVECQLLATMPDWRGRGYASRLLADAEDRYREAGYRAIYVAVDTVNREAVDWYRRRGYVMGGWNAEPVVQFWNDRMHMNAGPDRSFPDARRRLLSRDQCVGFKALCDDVLVKPFGGLVRVANLIGTPA